MVRKKRKAYERKKKKKDSPDKLVSPNNAQKLPQKLPQKLVHADWTPSGFTGMDILEFLGRSALGLSSLVLAAIVYWLASCFSVERIVGLFLFLALLGIPISRIESKKRSLPIQIITFLSIASAACFLPLAVPLLELKDIAEKASYRPIRVILGLCFFPVALIITWYFNIPLYFTGYMLIFSMGLVSSLLLMIPEIEKDPTRMSAFSPQDEEENPAILQMFPLPEQMPIYLHFQTAFQKFLTMIIWLCAGLGLISLFFWITWISLIPFWVTYDALAALSGALVLQYFSKACYIVYPQKKKLLRFTMNPLMVEARNIAPEELAGIVIGRSHKTFGILQKTTKTDCVIHVIFKTGLRLTIPSPDLSEFSEMEVEAHLEGYARRLAEILNCPFLNLLTPTTWSEWKSCQEDFFNTIPGVSVPPFLPTLWEVFCESNSFDLPAKNEFEMVKSDSQTMREWIVLGSISLLFAVTTILMLWYEWDLLIGNPRFFYLILLDCSSIVVTLLAVWRWFIDEYYLFDLNTREIFFYSRILFFRRKSLLGSFSDVSHLFLENRLTATNKPSNRHRLKLVLGKTGEDIVITTFSTRENMKSRGRALAALLEVKFLGLEKEKATK